MSKILEATCEGGVVTSEGVAVPGAEILSEGVGESQGLLLMQGDKKTYMASNATDLKTTIEKVVEAINKVGTILTAIGAGMTGPTTAPPGTLATDVLELTQLATELETLKGNLK